MNTSRILDILPASATSAPSPTTFAPAERAARAVAPVAASPDGGSGGVPDSVRQRVAAEVQRQTERTERRSLADQVSASRNLTSRVGYYDGSTMVFVDLLDARTQRALLRVFGPSEPPPEPSLASEAYEAALRLPGAGEGLSRA